MSNFDSSGSVVAGTISFDFASIVAQDAEIAALEARLTALEDRSSKIMSAQETKILVSRMMMAVSQTNLDERNKLKGDLYVQAEILAELEKANDALSAGLAALEAAAAPRLPAHEVLE